MSKRLERVAYMSKDTREGVRHNSSERTARESGPIETNAIGARVKLSTV